MRAATWGLFGLALIASWAEAKPVRPNAEDQLRVMTHVRFLASPELRGRAAGSQESAVAARYLAEQFRQSGLETPDATQDYLQPFQWAGPRDSPAHETRRDANVVGLIQGRSRRLSAEWIVLVAHFDGQGTTLKEGREIVLPGARDNALGIATLLYAAKVLAARPPQRSVLVVATSAEEEGMRGSRHFVEHPPVPLSRLRFVLNTDGAGVYAPDRWCIGGLERTTAHRIAARAGIVGGLKTVPYPEAFRFLFEQGDALPFVQAGVPALTVSPGFERVDGQVQQRVHTSLDRVDATFDETYLLRFARAFAAFARSLADLPELPGWSTGMSR